MLARGSRTLLRPGRVAARGTAPSVRTTAARRTAWRTASAGGPRPPAPAPAAPPPPPPAKYAAPPPPLRPQQQHHQMYEEPPQTFGSTMKTYFTLGIGVSLGVTAFSVLLRMVGF